MDQQDEERVHIWKCLKRKSCIFSEHHLLHTILFCHQYFLWLTYMPLPFTTFCTDIFICVWSVFYSCLACTAWLQCTLLPTDLVMVLHAAPKPHHCKCPYFQFFSTSCNQVQAILNCFFFHKGVIKYNLAHRKVLCFLHKAIWEGFRGLAFAKKDIV